MADSNMPTKRSEIVDTGNGGYYNLVYRYVVIFFQKTSAVQLAN